MCNAAPAATAPLGRGVQGSDRRRYSSGPALQAPCPTGGGAAQAADGQEWSGASAGGCRGYRCLSPLLTSPLPRTPDAAACRVVASLPAGCGTGGTTHGARAGRRAVGRRGAPRQRSAARGRSGAGRTCHAHRGLPLPAHNDLIKRPGQAAGAGGRRRRPVADGGLQTTQAAAGRASDRAPAGALSSAGALLYGGARSQQSRAGPVTAARRQKNGAVRSASHRRSMLPAATACK